MRVECGLHRPHHLPLEVRFLRADTVSQQQTDTVLGRQRAVEPEDEFVDPVRHLCLLLTPGLIAMALGSSSSAFYVATGRTKTAARIILVGAPLGALAVLSGAAMSSPAGAAIGLSLAQQGELVHMIFVLRWLREGRGT